MNTNSSLLSRIAKLEGRFRNDERVLLLWMPPGAEAESTVAFARELGSFVRGDMVMCAEWQGEDPVPKPRWLKRTGDRLPDRESRYVIATIDRRIARGRSPEVAGAARSPPVTMPQDLASISSVDLMYCALGVPT
jgi:hypothetical protein